MWVLELEMHVAVGRIARWFGWSPCMAFQVTSEKPCMAYQVPSGPPSSAQRVPEPDPLPGIFFDTRPDPIQF